ncbi:MAG: FAD-binding oxidoreductase, partial [Pseudomonadota bacterium]|nr:FAD-binding oxidoreductase [Pseudomonadota bacterium]
MRTHAQAVVIGGGLVGCSILYHLAKLGWRDVILLERDELTSGSTWHAAANIHGLHDNNNITRIQHYTMNLYKELEAETGQGCGVFQPGSLYLAQTEEREHQLRLQEAKAKFYGLGFYEVSREEARELHPLAQFDDLRCIMFEPDGGNVDPSGVTHAYAAGARLLGAEIERFCPVTGTEAQPDGSWIVRTEKGDIHTQWVVNAAGLWGREVAAMAGLALPLQPTEHQYFVTEAIDEVATLGRRLPSIADRDGEYYFRQEGNGLLIGAYEEKMKFWAEEGTPLDFGHELFDDDLDRIMENVMRAIDRVPAAAEAEAVGIVPGRTYCLIVTNDVMVRRAAARAPLRRPTPARPAARHSPKRRRTMPAAPSPTTQLLRRLAHHCWHLARGRGVAPQVARQRQDCASKRQRQHCQQNPQRQKRV